MWKLRRLHIKYDIEKMYGSASLAHCQGGTFELVAGRRVMHNFFKNDEFQ